MKRDRNSLGLAFWLIAALVCLSIGPPGVTQASFVFSHSEDASYASLVPKDHELVDTDGLGVYTLYVPGLTSLLPPEVNIDAVDLLSGGRVAFSLSEDAKIGATIYADEDLLLWDGAAISLLWDGSANGLPPEVNLDAVDIISDSPLEFSFSFEEDTPLPGAGLVADEDMVRFLTGSGFLASLDFDGSGQGVLPEANLNAFSRNTDTLWILSFDAATIINSILYDDDDLIEFNSASGTFSLYFDGSAQSIPEEVELNAMALPVPTPTPSPTPTHTPTPTATPSPTPTPTPVPVILTVEDSSGCLDATNVPVQVSLDNTMNVKSIQLTLCDVPDLLTTGSLAPEPDPIRAPGFIVDANQAGGCVEVYMVSLTGDLIAPGTGPIFTLYYDVDQAATVCTNIDVQLTYYDVTDENNNPVSVTTEDGNFKVGVKGDLDGDCDCDLFDVLRQIDIVLDKPPDPTACELWAGDMDDDDDIDLFDVLDLIDCILGIIPCDCADK